MCFPVFFAPFLMEVYTPILTSGFGAPFVILSWIFIPLASRNILRWWLGCPSSPPKHIVFWLPFSEGNWIPKDITGYSISFSIFHTTKVQQICDSTFPPQMASIGSRWVQPKQKHRSFRKGHVCSSWTALYFSDVALKGVVCPRAQRANGRRMDDGFQEVFFLQKMLETPVFFMVDLKTDFFGNGIISYIYIYNSFKWRKIDG